MASILVIDDHRDSRDVVDLHLPVDGLLRKPVDPAELEATLSALLRTPLPFRRTA